MKLLLCFALIAATFVDAKSKSESACEEQTPCTCRRKDGFIDLHSMTMQLKADGLLGAKFLYMPCGSFNETSRCTSVAMCEWHPILQEYSPLGYLTDDKFIIDEEGYLAIRYHVKGSPKAHVRLMCNESATSPEFRYIEELSLSMKVFNLITDKACFKNSTKTTTTESSSTTTPESTKTTSASTNPKSTNTTTRPTTTEPTKTTSVHTKTTSESTKTTSASTKTTSKSTKATTKTTKTSPRSTSTTKTTVSSSTHKSSHHPSSSTIKTTRVTYSTTPGAASLARPSVLALVVAMLCARLWRM